MVEYHRSAKFPHAGVGVLRNYETPDIETFGLMGYIGGAHYVHSHLTGIEMELYGSGMVMGAGSGDPKAPPPEALKFTGIIIEFMQIRIPLL